MKKNIMNLKTTLLSLSMAMIFGLSAFAASANSVPDVPAVSTVPQKSMATLHRRQKVITNSLLPTVTKFAQYRMQDALAVGKQVLEFMVLGITSPINISCLETLAQSVAIKNK